MTQRNQSFLYQALESATQDARSANPSISSQRNNINAAQNDMSTRDPVQVSTQSSQRNNVIVSDIQKLEKEKEELKNRMFMLSGQLAVEKSNNTAMVSEKTNQINTLRNELSSLEKEKETEVGKLQSQVTFLEASLTSEKHRVQRINGEISSRIPGTVEWMAKLPSPTKTNKRLFATISSETKSSAKKAKTEMCTNNALTEKLTNNMGVQCDGDYSDQKQNAENIAPNRIAVAIADKEVSSTASSNIAEETTAISETDHVRYVIKSVEEELQLAKFLMLCMDISTPYVCCHKNTCPDPCVSSNKCTQLLSFLLNDANVHQCGSNDKKITEIKKELLLQTNTVITILKQRKGSIEVRLLKLSQKCVIPIEKLLINPRYNCIFHYLYPMQSLIQKFTYLVPEHPLVISELICCNRGFIEALVMVINDFQVDFSLASSALTTVYKTSMPNPDASAVAMTLHKQCRSQQQHYETDFLEDLIRLMLAILNVETKFSQEFWRILCQNYNRFLPLFGARHSLVILVLRLLARILAHRFQQTSVNGTEGTEIPKVFLLCNVTENDGSISGCCRFSLIIQMVKHSHSQCSELKQINLLYLTLEEVLLGLTKSGHDWKKTCDCILDFYRLLIDLGVQFIEISTKLFTGRSQFICFQTMTVLHRILTVLATVTSENFRKTNNALPHSQQFVVALYYFNSFFLAPISKTGDYLHELNTVICRILSHFE